MNYYLSQDDYARRVYAGVLGKMIGVYLGRPFEGMAYRDILAQLGPINYYVHEQRKRELVITDDDLTGTFIFPRALDDFPAAGKDITPRQVGQTWLNYVIENKTIFWWGGMGLSTEHTAFLRLKNGIAAPESGSIALNSQVVAEQIGSQIFIDGWAMVSPGDPALAAELARKAASVSHDGEAIYGAQVIAAIEAAAFVERDLNKLLDIGVSFIPADSIIAKMIAELRAFYAKHPDDWERAFVEVLEASYGYDKFAGNCHIVPNHGVVILALLYGGDSFQRTQMIANTAGWDTDCNAGNVGCITGIRLGLEGIDAGPDWRGPVADRLLLPTADGGESITDAVRETYRLVNLGRALRGLPLVAPKGGARFHFSLPGSVQGFREEISVESRGVTTIGNRDGRLMIGFSKLAAGRVARVATSTFAPLGTAGGQYSLHASPTLFSGQTVRAVLRCEEAQDESFRAGLYVRLYDDGDVARQIVGPAVRFDSPGEHAIEWTLGPTDGRPIFEIGIELTGQNGASGMLLVDSLTWSGAPDITLGVPKYAGEMVRRQWVESLDGFRLEYKGTNPNEAFFAVQNVSRGLAMHGTRDWRDYTVSATLTPHLARATGLAARVRGLRRYYALLFKHPNRVALVKMYDDEQTLAETPFQWQLNNDPHAFALTVDGGRLIGTIDGRRLFDVVDPTPIETGGIGLVIEEGRLISGAVRVQPIQK